MLRQETHLQYSFRSNWPGIPGMDIRIGKHSLFNADDSSGTLALPAQWNGRVDWYNGNCDSVGPSTAIGHARNCGIRDYIGCRLHHSREKQ